MPTPTQAQTLPEFRLVPVPALDGSGAEAHEMETDGHTVAHIYPDTGEDYAERVLTACNSHSSDRAEIKALRAVAEYAKGYAQSDIDNDRESAQAIALRDMATAALSLGGGK